MTRDAVPNQVCLLWHGADETPSDALIRVLDKRGFSVMPSASVHTIFAAACRCVKSAKRVVIVLDDRESLVGVDRLLDALDRFAPSVICWEHCQDANPPMVPVVRVGPSISSEPAPPTKRTTTGAQPGTQPDAQLRLVGEDEGGAQRSAVSLAESCCQKNPMNQGPINARDVLDADELDALLAGELGEDRGRQ